MLAKAAVPIKNISISLESRHKTLKLNDVRTIEILTVSLNLFYLYLLALSSNLPYSLKNHSNFRKTPYKAMLFVLQKRN